MYRLQPILIKFPVQVLFHSQFKFAANEIDECIDLSELNARAALAPRCVEKTKLVCVKIFRLERGAARAPKN